MIAGLQDAVWAQSFGTRARPTALAVFDGIGDALRASVEARVLDDRSHWRTHGRRGAIPFHTLGSPTYILEGRPPDGATEDLVRRRYGDVHQVLIERLTPILGEAVHWSPPDAVPGFHIFEAADDVGNPSLGMHIDAQYRHLDYSAEPGGPPNPTTTTELISATIVVRADGAAGLDYVPLPHVPGIPMRTRPCQHLAYEAGTLVMQFGLFPHSVSGFAGPGRRITLQAHAIRTQRGTWRLYW